MISLYQDLSMCHDWPFKKATVNLLTMVVFTVWIIIIAHTWLERESDFESPIINLVLLKKSNVVKTVHVPVLRWGQFIIISVLLLSLFNLWFFCISVTLSAFSLLSLFALSSFLWWNSVEAVREDAKGSRDQMIKAWFLKGRLSANPGLKF